MYICTQCNHIFEEGEGKVIKENQEVSDNISDFIRYFYLCKDFFCFYKPLAFLIDCIIIFLAFKASS